MIYFVDGPLAVGKTTYAEALQKQRKISGENYILHYEHKRENPLDFTSRAYLSKNEFDLFYNELLEAMYSYYGDDIGHGLTKVHSSVDRFAEGYLVSLNHLWFSDPSLTRHLQPLIKRRLCGGVFTVEEYCSLLLERWNNFASQLSGNDSCIFEGALFQNPLLDLLGQYQMSREALAEFYKQLLRPVICFPMEVHLICSKNYNTILHHAAVTRTCNTPRWIDGLLDWVDTSPYCRSHGFSGVNGAAQMCLELEQTMTYICKTNQIPYVVIERK